MSPRRKLTVSTNREERINYKWELQAFNPLSSIIEPGPDSGKFPKVVYNPRLLHICKRWIWPICKMLGTSIYMMGFYIEEAFGRRRGPVRPEKLDEPQFKVP